MKTNQTKPNCHSMLGVRRWMFDVLPSPLAIFHLPSSISILFLTLLLLPPAVVQAQFSYTTNNGTITITRYTGAGGAVTIPSTINGLPVTSIGDSAFTRSKTLTSVTLPDSVISIGNKTFEECSSLASITLGSRLTSIGEWTFHYCISLTSVRIPESVTSIGDFAFYHCASLTTITVDALNSAYSSADGILCNKSQTTLLQCPGGISGSYTVPDSVTSIEHEAFSWCMKLTSVTLPDSVASIGDRAFAICGNLASVTLSRSLTSIGVNVFGLCTNLASITIPSSVTNIAAEAFASCPSLSGIYFSGNAPAVSANAFNYSQKITVYYLPETTGWGATLAGRSTTLWNPLVQTGAADFGVRSNRFGFTISGTSGIVVVVEACTDLANPVWSPLRTNTLTDGPSYFNDPQWTNYPARFYRLRSP